MQIYLLSPVVKSTSSNQRRDDLEYFRAHIAIMPLLTYRDDVGNRHFGLRSELGAAISDIDAFPHLNAVSATEQVKPVGLEFRALGGSFDDKKVSSPYAESAWVLRVVIAKLAASTGLLRKAGKQGQSDRITNSNGSNQTGSIWEFLMRSVQEEPWLALRQFAQGEQVHQFREDVTRQELARGSDVDCQSRGKCAGPVLVTGGISQIIQRILDSGRKPPPYCFCHLYLFLHCGDANFMALNLTVEYLAMAVGTCQHYQSAFPRHSLFDTKYPNNDIKQGGFSLAFSK